MEGVGVLGELLPQLVVLLLPALLLLQLQLPLLGPNGGDAVSGVAAFLGLALGRGGGGGDGLLSGGTSGLGISVF